MSHGITLQLRPYQEKGIADLRQAYSEGCRAPLFVLPTGGGKTVTYAAIAQGAGARGNRVLVLEHRKELIRQASIAIGTLGVRHQVVSPADKVAAVRRAHIERITLPMIDAGSHVAVASVQTLARRMDWLAGFDPGLIIIDEAHHAVAGTWARIIEACPNSKLLGVTATPIRTDGTGLGNVFDRLVLGPTMKELIALGNLVMPRVFAPPLRADLSGVHITGGDYNAKELAEALDKPTITGDAVAHYGKLAPGRPAIVFCANVRHAENVAEQFRAAGYRFEVVTGEMDDDLRDLRIASLADGRLHGVVTVDVVSEGVDIPVAEVAILLRATQSESLFLQQVGRVLRPADGKEYGLVLDHVGNVMRHGMPHADREWSLEGRKKKKRGASEQQEIVRVVQCPKCYRAHDPAPTCPDCGHVYQVKAMAPRQRDGELQEIAQDPDEIARVRERLAQGKAKSLEDLMKLGHSQARAQHIIAAREEKERMQNELRELLVRWSRANGLGVYERWGFGVHEIRGMKPKQLRENINKVSEALFMGAVANDNQQALSLPA